MAFRNRVPDPMATHAHHQLYHTGVIVMYPEMVKKTGSVIVRLTQAKIPKLPSVLLNVYCAKELTVPVYGYVPFGVAV